MLSIQHVTPDSRMKLPLPSITCLTLLLVQIFPALLQAEDLSKKPHVVFLVGEYGYNTKETLSQFAKEKLEPQGFQVTFVHADPEDRNRFPGIEVIKEADLLFISVRRRTLPTEDLNLIRQHLKAGKPLVGIRTTSHAFALRKGQPEKGLATWDNFDVEVLGAKYDNHFQSEGDVNVTTQLRAEQHPILTGVRQKTFASGGHLYKYVDFQPGTKVLLNGVIKHKGQPTTMPAAWTNTFGKSRIFYTSLGAAKEFHNPAFTQILTNAIYWCLNIEVPGAGIAGSSADPAKSPASRNVYNKDAVAGDDVAKMVRDFKGRGEIGDDSTPTAPDTAVSQFQTVDDLTMELVAAEPDVMQPLYISWDERGRMWVVQYLQYPFPAGLKVVKYDQYLRAVFDKVPPPPPNHFVGKDKITVFEDTNGDGRYDSHKDVITGLNIATAVVTWRGGIWVLNPPYLLFYPDADGDDVPDGDPEVHLSGFGLEDTHAVANSLKWGPDGWLYGANGSTTTGTINSAATRNVHFKGQCIWRYNPESKVFEIFAEGGGNTFSVEIDSKGRVFSGTNNGSTRGMHYAQGGYAKKNWGKHGPLTNPFALGYYDHMRHKGVNDRFSQAFSIYEGGSWPEKYRGMVISANSLHNQVLASRLLSDSSTYRTEDIPPIVLTPDRWFRPVDVKIGPDGAVYLADWYDSRLTHVDPRDNWHKSSGRIFRLKSKAATPIGKFDLKKMSSDELVELFSHENKWFRQAAVRVLAERRDESIYKKLIGIALSLDDSHALEALWTLAQCNQLNDELASRLLAHPNEHLRRWTVRLLGDSRVVSEHIASQLASLATTESSSQVRSQLASSAKRLPAEQALRIVRQLVARTEDADDLHIPLLLWWAIESKAESDREVVVALFKEEAFWKLPLVESHLLERVMQRYAMTGTEEDLKTCALLLALAPGAEQQEKLMTGLLAAFQGRKIDGLPESLATALLEYQKSLGNSDLALALRLGDEAAITSAIKFVANESADRSQRLAYIEIMGQIKQPRIVAPLLQLLSRPAQYDVKRAALQALMNYDDAKIGKTIVGRYHVSLPDEQGVRSTALRVLASRKSWTTDLVNEVEAWRIKSQNVPLDIVQQMLLHNDPQLKKRIEKHWGKIRGNTPEETRKEMRRVASLLRSGQGDLNSGAKLFEKSCAKCHTLFGKGGKAGPDLTGYERTNLDFLLLAILDPSAAIREEYTNFVILTADGRTLTGLIDNQDTRTVTLRGVDGQTTLINREDIDELRAVPTSLMPDGVVKEFSDQQIRDLFAYVMSKAPSSN
jgi:putative membrane-bound dehydrogenase-like protein